MSRKIFVGVTIDKDLDNRIIEFLSKQPYGSNKSAFYEKALLFYFENYIYKCNPGKDEGLLISALKKVQK